MEKVADVLARKYPQFNTVSPHHLISDALYQMCCENIDYLIVLESEKFQGILTSSDIANKVLFNSRQLNEVTVKEFMNTNLPVATLDDSIEYCLLLLERHNAKFLAVYDQFTFKGVVTYYDLMQEALAKRNTIFEDAPSEPFTWNY